MKMGTALLAVLAAAVLANTATARAEEFDFRRTRWGMTPEEVRAAETDAEIAGETEDILHFRGEIAGVKTAIIYVFRDGALDRGGYAIDAAEGERVTEDYRAIRSFLIGLHGGEYEWELNPAPGETGEFPGPDDLEILRELVLAGAVDPVAVWDTGRAAVYLRLTGKDGRAVVEVHYLSRPGIR